MTFLARLAAVVDARGDAPAVVEDGRPTSYRALWERAAAVGERLRAAGAGPERVVALHLPKSTDYLVAMLGAWHAGAAFLPLAPDLPEARAALLARDAGAIAVVARGPVPHLGLPVVAIDHTRAAAPPHAAKDADLAYVIYTSGSTGAPKGVLVEHRGIVPFLDAQLRAFRLDAASRVLFYLSTSFDASISDVGTALLAGATLFIEADLSDVAAILHARAITHADLPPSLLSALDETALPPSLRTVIIGGEPCPPEVVRRWASRVRLVNVYGPTEATVCTSLGVCDAATWDRPRIGRAIPGMRVFVGDAEGAPLPRGATGELWIGGRGLARGYANRPDLDRARFVTVAGERLYRTGDLGVEGEDGEIEFLGRVDRQVKLRGRLVAPEEIEARLASHPAIAEAAVVARRLAPAGRPVLVAFVAARAGGTVPPRDVLDAHVAAALPAWMTPQRYVAVGALPRTRTGKVDRAALEHTEIAAGVAAPAEGDVERALLAAFREVLGTDAVGPADDFFELGGDSIGVVEIVRAAEARGVAVSAAAVSEARTVRALAARANADDDAMTAEALRDDALREAHALPRAPELPLDLRAVLVTGATGLLGARVVAELLRRTRLEVHALVRADDDAAASARLRAAVPSARPEDAARLHALAGDVGRPRFGLGEHAWSALAGAVDGIVHLATEVDEVRPYAELRATNVGGVASVLHLAAAGRPKRVCHASTLSVFTASDRAPGAFDEGDDLSATRAVRGGYAQSKWAAEALLRAAGGAVTIVRLGLLVADEGAAPPAGDLLAELLDAAVCAGALPADAPADLAASLAPVGWAARALVHLALAPHRGAPETFHLTSPAHATLADVERALGAPLARAPRHALPPRLRRLALPRRRYRPHDLFEATGSTFATARAEAALDAARVACPSPASILAAYVRYLRERS